eukprot:CAMPEP_0116830130 /NCGR_PEP_ID=MMETSP0418-20121206/4596_1 /TAXON_ID=1158023 /ORGANISM="Astrosyne radiata, Strain 13vi08-1A" /LENGTH=137 /DNA_ID=CAMNT_0004459207 /DNA_START=419 /DNA_END=832 /DNA_ORIENTATION=-
MKLCSIIVACEVLISEKIAPQREDLFSCAKTLLDRRFKGPSLHVSLAGVSATTTEQAVCGALAMYGGGMPVVSTVLSSVLSSLVNLLSNTVYGPGQRIFFVAYFAALARVWEQPHGGLEVVVEHGKVLDSGSSCPSR